MKVKHCKKATALALIAGIALNACGVTSGKATSGKVGSTSSVTSGGVTVEDTSFVGVDGLAMLDSVREISETNVPNADVYSTSLTGDVATIATMMAENQKPHADSDDTKYDESSTTKIQLNGASAIVDGSGAEAKENTVTITAEGTYVVSGDFNGQLVVSAGDEAKVKIVLAGANISSSTDAAIRVNSADEAVIILAEGSDNSISDTASYDENSSGPSAALASSADLTIGGSGALHVRGNGNDGISSSDGLVVTGGVIDVTAVDDAVRGKDYAVIAAGTLELKAGGDAVKSDNEDDSGRGYVLVTGGSVTGSAGSDMVDVTSDVILAGGSLTATSSVEGIEAAHVYMAGGDVSLNSSDDGLNATGGSAPWLAIAGGVLVLRAGGDGIDSNGAAFLRGGDVTVWGPNSGGNGSLDTDGGFTISGGKIFTAGVAGMAQAPSADSSQAAIMVRASVPAGSVVAVRDSEGKEIGRYTMEISGQSLIFSSPDVVSGQTYTVTVDGSEAASAVAGEYDAVAGPGGGMGGPGGGPGVSRGVGDVSQGSTRP